VRGPKNGRSKGEQPANRRGFAGTCAWCRVDPRRRQSLTMPTRLPAPPAGKVGMVQTRVTLNSANTRAIRRGNSLGIFGLRPNSTLRWRRESVTLNRHYLNHAAKLARCPAASAAGTGLWGADIPFATPAIWQSGPPTPRTTLEQTMGFGAAWAPAPPVSAWRIRWRAGRARGSSPRTAEPSQAPVRSVCSCPTAHDLGRDTTLLADTGCAAARRHGRHSASGGRSGLTPVSVGGRRA
jgi:hypothetical protein